MGVVVSSGIRTHEEQRTIFQARYTRTPNGRRVYDKRWWNGQLWYRVSADGTPAHYGPKFLKSDTMRAPGSAMALDRGWLGDLDSTAFDGLEFSINGQSITGNASFMRIRGIA